MSTLPCVTCSSQTHIRPYMDLLMHIVLMQDTWQLHHLLPSLKDICCLKPTWWFTPLVCLLWICYNVLLRIQTSLWWSPGDHPVWTVPLPGRAYLCITFLVSLYSSWIFYVCHSTYYEWATLYAWNHTKSGRCMLNVCVFNAVQCMCTCGSSTHCVCVSVCLCICVCVCLLPL